MIKLTEFEIARTKRLAQQLASADLIEKAAYAKIIKYYENLAKASDSADLPEAP